MYLHYRKVTGYGYNKVELLIDGEILGNQLDDNSYIEDGFRFHDLYHIGLYEFFKVKESVIDTLLTESKQTFKNRIEEAVVLLMFIYSKTKDEQGLTNITMLDTIIDLLSMMDVYIEKQKLKTFIDETYKIIKNLIKKFNNFCDDVFLSTTPNNNFKIS